jgi:hypothetical protein
MTGAVAAATPFATRRIRTLALRDRWPFAAELANFVLHVLAAQERAFVAAAQTHIDSGAAALRYAASEVFPEMARVAAAHGPHAMALGVQSVLEARPDPEQILAAWLRGEELSAVEHFLARAAAGPVLEVMGRRAADVCAAAGAVRPGEDAARRHCPQCWGPPQVSVFDASPDALVTGRRSLECARCAARWPFARLTCAACGETGNRMLEIFAEEGTLESEMTGHRVRGRATPEAAAASSAAPQARFGHVRIDVCRACRSYILTVDAGRDPQAVPAIDDLLALPLHLYAADGGWRRIAPNLMGL